MDGIECQSDRISSPTGVTGEQADILVNLSYRNEVH